MLTNLEYRCACIVSIILCNILQVECGSKSTDLCCMFVCTLGTQLQGSDPRD
jgi:hypothetical protein